MRRQLGLLLVLLALACVADAFTFLGAGRSPALRVASRQESSLLQRPRQVRRMAAPSMMAGGGKKKVLVLGGDGCVKSVCPLDG